MAGKTALLNALHTAAGKTQEKARAVVAEPPPPAPAPGRQASREGKTNISAWLPMAYKVSLLTLKVKFPNSDIQDFLQEALDDLFAKHDVPVVNAGAETRPPAMQPRPRAARRSPG
jgi:hypothetical protein